MDAVQAGEALYSGKALRRPADQPGWEDPNKFIYILPDANPNDGVDTTQLALNYSDTSEPWDITPADFLAKDWYIIDNPTDLTPERVEAWNPGMTGSTPDSTASAPASAGAGATNSPTNQQGSRAMANYQVGDVKTINVQPLLKGQPGRIERILRITLSQPGVADVVIAPDGQSASITFLQEATGVTAEVVGDKNPNPDKVSELVATTAPFDVLAAESADTMTATID